MEATTTTASPTHTTTKARTKPAAPRRIFSAEQKTRAVLEVWTESRKPVQIARELEITTALLDLWQKKAMKAIITAMEPRQGDPGKESALSPRIEQMLRAQARKAPVSRLVQRLGVMQAGTQPEPTKPASGKRKPTSKSPPKE